MKALIKEAVIAGCVGLALGYLILFLAARGWVPLPLLPDKGLVFVLGTGLFSSVFRLVMLVGERNKASTELS